MKNLDIDMQYRSSTELANKLKIKREQHVNEHNDRAKKQQTPIPHKIKNSEEVRTSHMTAGKGKTKQRLFCLKSPLKRKELNFL